MNSEGIISNVGRIYAQFPITDLLRTHMLNVAGVGNYICDNWKGPEINKTDVVAFLLIHDLGNLVKFDLEWSKIHDTEIIDNYEHWKTLQNETIAKYGKDEEKVNRCILSREGMTRRLMIWKGP